MLVRVDVVVRKVNHEQELEQTALREIQRIARIEAEASADDDRGARQLDGGHAPERVDVGAAVLRVIGELIDLAVAGRLFVEEHRVSAGEAADDVAPGRAPAVASLAQGQVPQTITFEDLSPPRRAVVSQDRAVRRVHHPHDRHMRPGSPIRKLAPPDEVARRVGVEDCGEAGCPIGEQEAIVRRVAEASRHDVRPAVASRTNASEIRMLTQQ